MGGASSEGDLERLLASAARDPAERPAFAQALLDSSVYVLGVIEGEVIDGVVQPGASMNIRAIDDREGQVTPFFTSEHMLQATLATLGDRDRRYVRLPCRSLFETTAGSRLVLNPHGPHLKVYLPTEISALLLGKEPGVTTEVVREPRSVLVGAAAVVPPELPEVLARFFVQRPTVAAAHLGWIAHPDGHEGFLMVVVASDRDTAMSGLGSVEIGEVTGGPTLDVVVVPPGSDDHLLSSVPPFYTRPVQSDTPESRKRGRFRRS